MARRLRIALRVGAGLMMATCVAWPTLRIGAQAPAVASSPGLRDLASISQLQASFDADREKIRIVLLLSPT